MATVLPWQGTTSGVNVSVFFSTKLRRLLAYKEVQPAKVDVIWCKTYSPGSFGLCTTAVREEEEEEEDDKTWE